MQIDIKLKSKIVLESIILNDVCVSSVRGMMTIFRKPSVARG